MLANSVMSTYLQSYYRCSTTILQCWRGRRLYNRVEFGGNCRSVPTIKWNSDVSIMMSACIFFYIWNVCIEESYSEQFPVSKRPSARFFFYSDRPAAMVTCTRRTHIECIFFTFFHFLDKNNFFYCRNSNNRQTTFSVDAHFLI